MRAGFAGRPFIRQQQFIELVSPGANLRKRLRLSLVAELGRLRSDHLPHDLPRHSQLAADQFDRLALRADRNSADVASAFSAHIGR